MLNVIINACNNVVADTDFWLLSVLGDWTLEETNRSHFSRYLNSWAEILPENFLSRVKLGINERLKVEIEEQQDVRIQVHRNMCYPDCRDRSDLALVTDKEVPLHVEVKYVYDCTYSKQYRHLIPADSKKPLDYQIVFFATLPNYHYPAGVWYDKKWTRARQTVIMGINEQYSELCKFLRPADYPLYHVYLPWEASTITEECIRKRFYDAAIFRPDNPWEFRASSELKDAQVGYAIWDWSQARCK